MGREGRIGLSEDGQRREPSRAEPNRVRERRKERRVLRWALEEGRKERQCSIGGKGGEMLGDGQRRKDRVVGRWTEKGAEPSRTEPS